MGGEGAAREGEDAPAPPRAGAGVYEEWVSAAPPLSVLRCHLPVAPYPSLSFCVASRCPPSSSVWIHEPWQRSMSSLWSRQRRNGQRGWYGAAPRARAPLTHVSHPQRVLRSAAPCLGGCRFHSRPLPQGYDPDATAPFQPKPKQKGRSSTASLVKRKRKVMDQEHRVRGQGGGQAGRPAGSALLLAPPTCGFSPVSPHPGQSPPEPGAAAAEAREGQAHQGPAVSPGQIRALSQAPRGPGATFFPHTHLWGMTRPWNEGAGSPLPPGVDSWFLGWGWGGGWPVLKRNVDFWITCLHHPGNLSPAHIQPGLLSDAGACLPSGPTPVLLWPCRAP